MRIANGYQSHVKKSSRILLNDGKLAFVIAGLAMTIFGNAVA